MGEKLIIDIEAAKAAFPAFLKRYSTPVPGTEVEELLGYDWKDSDYKVGMSYVQIPEFMNPEKVTVNGGEFVHDADVSGDFDGWFYYGPPKGTYSGRVVIEVTEKDGTVSRATVLLTKPSGKMEAGVYWGRPNANRPQWYFGKKANQYPPRIRVVIEECGLDCTIQFNGKRYDSGGLLVKQSSEPGRGLVILYKSSCKSKKCQLHY